jgi:ammonium transporter Rh
MTFLKRYGFGAVGFNFMLSAMVIQWSMLTNGFFHSLVPVSAATCEHAGAGAHGNKSTNFLTLTYGSAAPFAGCAWHKVQLGITNLITSDFAAGAVMISFGAILGKASPLQLLFMGIFEMLFCTWVGGMRGRGGVVSSFRMV